MAQTLSQNKIAAKQNDIRSNKNPWIIERHEEAKRVRRQTSVSQRNFLWTLRWLASLHCLLYFLAFDWLRSAVLLLGCLCGPVINSVFGRRCRKTVIRGREDTRIWYRETMFSQMVSYDFLLHGYSLYLVSAPPEKPTRRCKPEEGYLRCSKRFDHRSHSIIFLLFECKSVR